MSNCKVYKKSKQKTKQKNTKKKKTEDMYIKNIFFYDFSLHTYSALICL